MDTNINDINTQNVINREEKKINKKIGIIPLVLGLGLLVNLFLVVILIKERKNMNFYITDLQKQIKQSKEEMDNVLKLTNIQSKVENIEVEPTINQEIYSCDYWKNKVFDETQFNYPAGSLIVNGSIVKKDGIKYFSEDEKITRVYLVVSEQKENPQNLFYEYYREIVEKGNIVNIMEGQKILFKIGMIENSKFIPGLAMPDDLKNKIMSLIDKNETINLKITIAIPQGRSASDGESLACGVLE